MSHLRLRLLARKARSLETPTFRSRNCRPVERRGYALPCPRVAATARPASEFIDEKWTRFDQEESCSWEKEAKGDRSLRRLGLILSGLGLTITLCENPNNLLGRT